MKRPVRALALLSAAAILAACRTPRPVGRYDADKVVASLSSSSPEERDWAEKSLDLSDPNIAWNPLVRLFEDPSKSSAVARAAAVRVFSRNASYDRPLPPPVIDAVADDPDLTVRREALHAVMALGNPENLRVLKKAQASEKDPALKAELDKAVSVDWIPAARKWWRARIEKPSTETEYILSVRALASQGNPEDVAFLIDAGEKPSEKVSVDSARYEILLALSQLGGPQATDFVRGKLTSEDPYLRAAAAAVESRLKDPAAVEALGKILASDTVLDIRVSAARALGAIGGPDALKAAQASCKIEQPNVPVKLACKQALAQLTGKPEKKNPAPHGTRASAK